MRTAKLHGGTIYAVRIAHGGKESDRYVAGATGLATPPPGYAGGYTAGGLPTDYWQLMGLPPVKGKTPKPKAPSAPKAPKETATGILLKAAIASGKITPKEAVHAMIAKTLGGSKEPKKPYIIQWSKPYDTTNGPVVSGKAYLSDGTKIGYRILGKGHTDPWSNAFTKSAEFRLAANLGEPDQELPHTHGVKFPVYPNKLGVYTKVGEARKAAEADALARGAVMQGTKKNPRRTRRAPRRRAR